MRRSIEHALRERRRDESVAALRTQAEERGLGLVEYEGYQPTSYRSLREGLGLDADARRQHRRESCHAVTVEARWDGRAELVEVCTDWRRHSTRAKGNNSSAAKSRRIRMSAKPNGNDRPRAGTGPDGEPNS